MDYMLLAILTMFCITVMVIATFADPKVAHVAITSVKEFFTKLFK